METFLAESHDAGLKPPATIVIGEVVALREKFNWYETLPLFGKRIVVTRDRHQAADLAEPLEALGAEAVLLPTDRNSGSRGLRSRSITRSRISIRMTG